MHLKSRPQSRWLAYRQAYMPSMWNWGMVVTMLVGAGTGYVGALVAGWYGLIVTFPASLALGWYTSKRHWARWDRKHPPLSPQDQLEAKRRAGVWN